jgi:hypothetical protein
MSRLSLGSLSWVLVILAAAVTAAWLPASSAGDPFPLPFPFPGTFLGALGAPAEVASTVPATGPAAGDQNPYGVAVVPGTVGDLVRGDVLVSNFNAASNLQGTGTTIMQVDPRTGIASIFAQISPASVPGSG